MPQAARQPQALVTPSQQHDEGQGQHHHPGLADDLSQQEIEAAEGQVEKQDTVHHQADDAAGEDRQHQSPALQRRVHRQVRGFRKQVGRAGRHHESGGREERGKPRAGHHRRRRPADADTALHQVAQDERQPDGHHPARRHDPRRHRDQARRIRRAHRPHVADEPVGGRDAQPEPDEKQDPFRAPSTFDCRHRLLPPVRRIQRYRFGGCGLFAGLVSCFAIAVTTGPPTKDCISASSASALALL